MSVFEPQLFHSWYSEEINCKTECSEGAGKGWGWWGEREKEREGKEKREKTS